MSFRGTICLLVIGVSSGLLHASEVITESRPFNLGPGETVAFEDFPKFNPVNHPSTPKLTRVDIVLDVESFSADVVLFFDPRREEASTIEWHLGPAQIKTVPSVPGLAAPSAELSLQGSVMVAGNEVLQVSPTPSTSGYRIVSVSNGEALEAYVGEDFIKYDVDFLALYSIVTAGPLAAATGLFVSDRVRGTLTITYHASGPDPTSVVLAGFSAQETGVGGVWVSWRTGVESNILGFHLERRVSGGSWVRLNSQVIPATGGSGSADYGYQDGAAPSGTGIAYRLLAVDLAGQQSVLGETGIQPGFNLAIEVRDGAWMEISVQGEPGTQAILETAADLVRGPWIVAGTVEFDGQGRGLVVLGLSTVEPSRFYRVRQIP